MTVLIDSAGMLQAFATHLLSCGLLDQVSTHEPKAPPTGQGVTSSVWVRSIVPTTVPTASLTATTVTVTFTIRLHANMLQEPQDDIDPTLLRATDQVMSMITGDFTLGALVDEVDLLGMSGTPLMAEFGYINIGGTMFRICDITVPVVVHDAWSQAR